MSHLVTFLLDESGSMQARKDVTISGFNEWMQEMEKFPGEVMLNLIKFHSEKHEMLFKQAMLGTSQIRLSNENYQPAASTPLLDAVGRAIRETDEQLEHLPGDPEVIFVILTDGEENSSTEFSLEAIKALIQEKIDAGWAVTYLGASEDAWQGGQALGVPLGSTMNFVGTPDSVQAAMRGNSMALGQYMGGGSSAGGIYSEAGVTDDDGQLIVKDDYDSSLPPFPSAESDEDDDENDLS